MLAVTNFFVCFEIICIKIREALTVKNSYSPVRNGVRYTLSR